jgi:hypothetical protein
VILVFSSSGLTGASSAIISKKSEAALLVGRHSLSGNHHVDKVGLPHWVKFSKCWLWLEGKCELTSVRPMVEERSGRDVDVIPSVFAKVEAAL